MMSIHKELLKQGYDSYVVWGRGRKSSNKNEIYLNDKIGVYFHAFMSRLTGKNGFYSKRSTNKLIKRLEEIEPDIIHLHNIHGYYLNIELLFNYIKRRNIKVIWTLHDCWTFTGKCAHFTSAKCNKWKRGCYKCPLTKEYPKSFVDNTKWNYKKKKELFTNLSIHIVTPSQWLAGLVKESFLKEYKIEIINNGIDTNIFKPTNSDFREKYHLNNKIIILGVASVWDKRKGLNDFIELSKMIDDNYKIVLVGLSNKQLKQIPNSIIGINRTENQQKLAGLYSTADIFFNPSLEETFGLTSIEAQACGTPSIVYNSSALPEIVNGYGIIVDHNEDYLNQVVKKCQQYIKMDCNQDSFKYSDKIMIKKYIKMYYEIIKDGGRT